MDKGSLHKITAQEPCEEDMKLINRYTLRPMERDGVFTFSVILCDNEVDRDFERFSIASLKKLESLFTGRTGILDHSMKSGDQSARTYRTELVLDGERLTSYGEPYAYLRAWCYTVRSEKNSGLISDIEGGIKKEISVSCNAGRRVCSVCGRSDCSHTAGRKYGGEVCVKTLEDITDAYEWSFVAVPAQRNAGVTKAYLKERKMENILKALREKQDISLKSSESAALAEYIGRLEKMNGDAEKYRASLMDRLKKGFAVILPELTAENVEAMAAPLDSDALEHLRCAVEKQASRHIPAVSQLYNGEAESGDSSNQQFKF